MRHDNEIPSAHRQLKWVVILVAFVILSRLFYVQLVDDKYEDLAASNIMRPEVEYPMRGEVVDRYGEPLIRSRVCYDVMVVWNNLPKRGFDSLHLISILDISIEKLRTELAKARRSPDSPHLIIGYLPQDAKLVLDECGFDGIFTRFRTAREYPRKIGGNMLGYVSEISQSQLEKMEGYAAGDYMGVGGIESFYEADLKGEKGVTYRIRDTRGAVKGSYDDGAYDVLPEKGKRIVSTIDARLQEFAEELMVGKIGSVVAIEPSTGEILVMVSSPTYNPDLMVGRQRNKNYNDIMLHNQRKPQYSRAIKENYPPGSTFKIVQGLIGLQEGVLRPSQTYECYGGFQYGVGSHTRKLGCHNHRPSLNLKEAVAQSCNGYFCYVFKNILTNRKYANIKEATAKWNEYVYSFGFGNKLGVDLYGEYGGFVPTPEWLDKVNGKYWNWGTVISCAIGQGEMAATPLQMANLAAIIANRGYYYIPHIVKEIEGQEDIDPRFRERHYTMVDSIHFETVIDGMWMSVNKEGTSRRAELKGWDVCGKTGTAEHGRYKMVNGTKKVYEEHSAFMSFAPRNNPKIAIAVYIEHGRWGSTAAVPIASLIEEMYLTDTIVRQDMLQEILNMEIDYEYYDRMQRKYDDERNNK